MNTSASRWSQEWLPPVTTSAPASTILLVDRLGDAEAAGGVLAVDGDEIELPVAHQPRQPFEHDGAPAAADDVADEENAHARHVVRQSITSRSVSTRSRRASREVAGTVSISCAAKAMPTATTVLRARNALLSCRSSPRRSRCGGRGGRRPRAAPAGCRDRPPARRASARGCPRRRRRADRRSPGAHDQRFAATGDHRQREPRAGVGEPAHQRHRIDLALHRHEAGQRSRPAGRATGNGRTAIASAAAARSSAGNASRRASALRRDRPCDWSIAVGSEHRAVSAKERVRSRVGRRSFDPGFPTKVGGRHMSEPTSPVRDSSLAGSIRPRGYGS